MTTEASVDLVGGRTVTSANEHGAAELSGAPAIEATAGGTAHAFAKRSLDILVAVLAIVALLPLLLVVALAIKLDSRGPVLFRQRRLGREMRSFGVLKFRTMHQGASSGLHRQYIADLAVGGSADGAPLKKLTDDPRVTSVGRILRAFSIDELPQLFNVLVGHMSLVGPRPVLSYETAHYAPVHFERFDVRPGLTGLWQVSGRSQLGFHEMLALDVEYARGGTFATDLRILAQTPKAAISHTA